MLVKPSLQRSHTQSRMTLRQAADAAGVSRSHLSRILNGHRFPQLATVNRLTSLLAVDPSPSMTEITKLHDDEVDIDASLVARLLSTQFPQ